MRSYSYASICLTCNYRTTSILRAKNNLEKVFVLDMLLSMSSSRLLSITNSVIFTKIKCEPFYYSPKESVFLCIFPYIELHQYPNLRYMNSFLRRIPRRSIPFPTLPVCRTFAMSAGSVQQEPELPPLSPKDFRVYNQLADKMDYFVRVSSFYPRIHCIDTVPSTPCFATVGTFSGRPRQQADDRRACPSGNS